MSTRTLGIQLWFFADCALHLSCLELASRRVVSPKGQQLELARRGYEPSPLYLYGPYWSHVTCGGRDLAPQSLLNNQVLHVQ